MLECPYNVRLEISAHFNIDPTRCTLMSGYHNAVYYVDERPARVLRITPPAHRTYVELEAELAFMTYLSEQHAAVSAPLSTSGGSRVVMASGYFGCCFPVAKGKEWRERNDGPEDFTAIGRALGKIHALSKQYGLTARRVWSSNPYLLALNELLDRVFPPQVAEEFENLKVLLGRLRKNTNDYGLVHGDFLFSNYILDGARVNVIDFDDCEYNWYIYDLAVNVFYYLLGADPREVPLKCAEAEELLYHLLVGYLQETELDVCWCEQIHLFFRMREFILLASILQRSSLGDLSQWNAAYVETTIDRIVSHKPLIEADWVRAYNRAKELVLN